jgi:hypothetical protein
MQLTNIYRRSNGTVDMDVYRRIAFRLRRETTNQILRRFGRPVRALSGQIAVVVSYALLLQRDPVPQGTASKLAPAKVTPLFDSLRTPRLNHRNQ